MNFIDEFVKSVNKMDGVTTAAKPPSYWFSTGCFVLNKIISGSFFKGIAQGRLVGLAGPSGAGKSYLLANIIKQAQKDGAIIILLDSENALDDDFMTKIGVDVNTNYFYNGVSTVDHVVEIVSNFIKGYKKDFGSNNQSAPKVLIAIDSLDMLMTESEDNNFNAGIQKGDQGQKSKQLKSMLKTMVNGIKSHNISVVATTQVYKNQDIKNGEGVWIINNAAKFAFSQIVLLTKLKLRSDDKEVDGIRMICDCVKTRHTKPFQKVTVDVPYDSGMDQYSGLIDTLVSMGLVERKGAWYSIVGQDTKFQSKDIEKYANELLSIAEKDENAYIDTSIQVSVDDVDTDTETKADTKERRRTKITT